MLELAYFRAATPKCLGQLSYLKCHDNDQRKCHCVAAVVSLLSDVDLFFAITVW